MVPGELTDLCHPLEGGNALSSRFSVHPEILRQAGDAFDGHAIDLAAALAKLRGALPAVNAMCGDDASGQKFAADYGHQADLLQNIVDKMGAGLHGIGQGLRDTAKNYDVADQANAVRGGRAP